MAPLRSAVLLVLLVAASLAQDAEECGESELGFACVKALSSFYNLHWTLNEDTVDMALEGIRAEWVGFSFAEEADMMAPADAVIGWIDDEGVASVRAYRIEIQSVTPDNEDDDVALTDTSVTQDDTRTTVVMFTRSLTDGEVVIDPEAETLINYAIGDEDALVYHGGASRGSSTVTLSLGLRDEETDAEEEAETDAEEEAETDAEEEAETDAEEEAETDAEEEAEPSAVPATGPADSDEGAPLDELL